MGRPRRCPGHSSAHATADRSGTSSPGGVGICGGPLQAAGLRATELRYPMTTFHSGAHQLPLRRSVQLRTTVEDALPPRGCLLGRGPAPTIPAKNRAPQRRRNWPGLHHAYSPASFLGSLCRNRNAPALGSCQHRSDATQPTEVTPWSAGRAGRGHRSCAHFDYPVLQPLGRDHALAIRHLSPGSDGKGF